MNHWLTKTLAVAGALATVYVIGLTLWADHPRLFALTAFTVLLGGSAFRVGLDWRCRDQCSRWCLALAGGTARWTGDHP